MHWPAVLPGEVPAAWGQLRDWVELFLDRYAVDTRTVPPCWYRHTPMVEALAALRDHERGSYHPDSHPATAVDFIRAVHEILAFLRDQTARSGCGAADHRPESGIRRNVDEDDWRAFVVADQDRRAAILLSNLDDGDEDTEESTFGWSRDR
jgi:hypothetical protein